MTTTERNREILCVTEIFICGDYAQAEKPNNTAILFASVLCYVINTQVY